MSNQRTVYLKLIKKKKKQNPTVEGRKLCMSLIILAELMNQIVHQI